MVGYQPPPLGYDGAIFTNRHNTNARIRGSVPAYNPRQSTTAPRIPHPHKQGHHLPAIRFISPQPQRISNKPHRTSRQETTNYAIVKCRVTSATSTLRNTAISSFVRTAPIRTPWSSSLIRYQAQYPLLPPNRCECIANRAPKRTFAKGSCGTPFSQLLSTKHQQITRLHQHVKRRQRFKSDSRHIVERHGHQEHPKPYPKLARRSTPEMPPQKESAAATICHRNADNCSLRPVSRTKMCPCADSAGPLPRQKCRSRRKARIPKESTRMSTPPRTSRN